MPTYEYACSTCGDHLEVVQSFKDDALTTCPNCGGSLRKVFGSIGVVFKGSGFYKTDSRSSTKAAATSSSDKSEKPDTSAKKESASSSGTAKQEGSSGGSSSSGSGAGSSAPAGSSSGSSGSGKAAVS